jgi:hypothetical protein
MCTLALRGSQLFDWFDKRDIDKHLVMAIIMAGTVKITWWAAQYVDANPADAGTDVGLKVAAVMIPWSIIATPAIKWYFDSRPTG